MNFFSRLSIGSRLWGNLIIALAFVGFVTLVGWLASNHSADQAHKLVNNANLLTKPINQFHKDFINTLQQSNTFILTLDQTEGDKFNQMIDQQMANLYQLLEQMGAKVEPNASGFMAFIEEPTGPHAELMQQLQSLDAVLMNLKKATNSNVYLKNRLKTTIEYGLEPSAALLIEALKELMPLIEDQPGLVTNAEQLKQRLETSQLLAAKMIATQDTQLKAEFDEKGLGFNASPLVTEIEEAFAGDFFNQETARKVAQGQNDYFDAFGDLRDSLNTSAQNNITLAELSEQGNNTLLDLTSSLQKNSLSAMSELEQSGNTQSMKLLIIGALAVLVLLAINLSITRSIVLPLKRMRDQVLKVAHSGEFQHWPHMRGNNELAEMSRAQGELLQTVSQALHEIKTVSESLANGYTDQRMSEYYDGDLKRLSQTFNQSLASVASTMNEMSLLSHALEEGNLSFNIELEQHSGQFLEVLNAIMNALSVQKHAIDDIRRVTHAMRAGDFAQRVEIAMPGELHNLKRYLNESLERLESAINTKADALRAYSQGDFSHSHDHKFEGKLQELNMHMGNMAQSVSTMLQDVKYATDHAVHGIKEISSGNQDLNHRVQKQAAAIQNTSANMSVMMNSVRETLNEANQVTHTTDQVQKDSASGLAIVEQMVQAMQGIQDASQQITQITGLIDSIAFQTNLLALNASVEAARAGEAGRGFAVVATEVRNLAQRSAEAAQQIRQVTDTNMQRIEQGMDLSQQTQTVFEQNTASIERVAKMIVKMNSALELQSHGIKEVTDALSDIDESTQQNAALVEQIATTSSNIIEEVLGLETKVSGFKLLTLPNKAA
jgi:methyl-accepting chemotaxis protein